MTVDSAAHRSISEVAARPACRPWLEVPVLALLGIGLLWTGATWLAALRRHLEFQSYLHDLGIFEHLIWNTAQGRFFDSTIYPFNYLGLHFSPMLLVFVPLYRVWPETSALLLMQAAVVALGAAPAYRLARHWLGAGWTAALAGVVALLNPYNLFLTVADFHPDVLAGPLLGAGFYAIETRRDRWLVGATIGLLLVREDFALAVVGLGAYLVTRRRFALGGALAIGGAAYLLVMILAVMPAIAGRPYSFGDLNPALGAGPLGVLTGAAVDPIATVRQVFEPPRPEYLLWLFGPWLGLPLLRPLRLLPGLPLLLRNLIAASPNLSWINRHFHAAIVPALTYAGIAAIAGLPPVWARRAVVAALAAAIAFNGYALIGLIGPEIPAGPRADAAVYRAAIALVPPDASVAAGNRIGAHLARRHDLWFFPGGTGFLADPAAAEWVVTDLADRPGWQREQSLPEIEARLAATFPPERYAEVFRQGTVVVLRRNG